MKLPEWLDPATPVGQLTDEQLNRLAASVVASRRWQKATAEDRAAQGAMLANKRRRNMTKAQRSAIAKNAGIARAVKAGQKLRPENEPAATPLDNT